MASILIAAAVLLAACGGKPAAPSSPAPTTTPPPTAPTSPSAVDTAALRAKGEEIFQKTAGGVGCQSCHGADGKGTNSGPDILGKTADDIKRALGGDAMSFIHLTEEEIQAVAAYVKTLQ